MEMKMNDEDLILSEKEADEILDAILKRIKNTLKVKAKEYVRNSDRMHNMNKGSDKIKMPREKVIEFFRLKHDVSRDDLIKDLNEGKVPSIDYVSEKYGDIINYWILEEMSVRHKVRVLNDKKKN